MLNQILEYLGLEVRLVMIHYCIWNNLCIKLMDNILFAKLVIQVSLFLFSCWELLSLPNITRFLKSFSIEAFYLGIVDGKLDIFIIKLLKSRLNLISEPVLTTEKTDYIHNNPTKVQISPVSIHQTVRPGAPSPPSDYTAYVERCNFGCILLLSESHFWS